jgi:WD40 repeat protein
MANLQKLTASLVWGLVGLSPVVAPLAAGQSSRKLALVIGIGGYDDRVGRLPNAENDAKSVQKALEDIGFQVTPLFDIARADWLSEMDRFASSILVGDVVLLYYAGHGVQVNGTNYMLPSDFSAESDPSKFGIALDDLIRKFSARAPKLKIFVIDACRNNPFNRGLKPGLADVSAVAYGDGTYIAMAASPGQLATDGLFARHFVAALGIRGLEIREIFTEVRRGVVRDSGNRELPVGADLISESYVLAPRNPKATVERVRVLSTGNVHSAALSPDGRLVAVTGTGSATGEGGPVQLWSVQDGARAGTLEGPDRTTTIEFSPDSSRIAAGSEKALWVWEVATRKVQRLEDKGMGSTLSLSFSPDGRLIAASSTDKRLRVWNLETSQLEAVTVKTAAQADWIAFAPDTGLNTILAIGKGSKPPVAFAWRWRTKAPPTEIPDVSRARSLVFAPNGRMVVGGLPDGGIQSWDLADNGRAQPSKVFQPSEHSTDVVEAMAFNLDGGRLASGGGGIFRWWDAYTTKQLRKLESPAGTGKILGLSFIPDGRLLALARGRASDLEILYVPPP